MVAFTRINRPLIVELTQGLGTIFGIAGGVFARAFARTSHICVRFQHAVTELSRESPVSEFTKAALGHMSLRDRFLVIEGVGVE